MTPLARSQRRENEVHAQTGGCYYQNHPIRGLRSNTGSSQIEIS
jgi:hypothetical protein